MSGLWSGPAPPPGRSAVRGSLAPPRSVTRSVRVGDVRVTGLRMLLLALASFTGACGPDIDMSGTCLMGSCGSPSYNIRFLSVETATSGDNIDSDGYHLSIVNRHTSHAEESMAIGVNEMRTSFLSGPTWVYVVRLSGVAENCSVEGENPHTVNVDGSTPVRFVVHCR